MMWPGHAEEFDIDTSRMANVLHAHVPLAMSLCHVDYVKMQSSLQNHMYNPGAYEGILELRKEKSRDAARSRRGKENYEFYELAKLLPLPAAITSQLDKASIIRLTISYLKLRDFSGHGDPPWNREEQNLSKALKSIPSVPPQCRSTLNLVQDVFESHQGTHILQSLDGFAFALSNDARFLYISETVSIYLGLSQVEMAGSSIFEYIHSHDHKELAEQLGLSIPKPSSSFSSPSGTSDEGSSSTPNPTRSTTPVLDRVSVMSPNPSNGYDRCFCIRMKSTLTKRGVHFKSSGYRVVQIVAHLRPQYSYPSSSQKQLPPLLGLVGMAIALPPPTITELIIDNDMFITRLSPQLKVTYCEPRLSDMMDMPSEDLLNRSLYDFCHAEDLRKLNKAHSDLLNKGQVLTDYYRLMNKHGGYVWIQTCATIICNAKNVDDQNIIAINYVLSGIEYSGCVMSVEQYKAVNKSDHEIGESVPETDFPRSEKSTFQNLGSNMSSNDINQFSRSGVKTSFYDKMPAFEVRSPTENALQHTEEANSFSLHESKDLNEMKSCLKSTPKSARRKMEKPRKRKRGSCDDPKTGKSHTEVNEPLQTDDVLTDKAVDPNVFAGSKGINFHKSDEQAKNNSKTHNLSENRLSKQKNKTSEASSVRSLASSNMATKSNNEGEQSRKKHAENSNEMLPDGVWIDKIPSSGCSLETFSSDQNNAKSRPSKQSCDKDSIETNTAEAENQLVEVFPPKKNQANLGATVHDLEAAMNKHLPVSSSFTSSHQLFTSGYFHSSMLGIPKSKSSTIQWIGGGGLMGQPCVTNYHADLSLLRSLYPGRESVIRSNVYSQGRLQSHQQLQYYQADAQSSQLTPPGDAFQHGSSSNYSKSSGTTGGFSPYLSYNAHGLSEAYSVTPPSSVSPQDPPLYAPLQLFDHLHQHEQAPGFASQSYARDSNDTNSAQVKAPLQPGMPGSQYGNYDHYYYHQANFNPSYNGHNMSMVPYSPYMSGGPVNGPHLETMKNLW